MTQNRTAIISASRRTDIPAFYMEWFMRQLSLGFFEVINPVSQQKRNIPADIGHIHSIVFWSKNFSPFIETGAGDMLKKKGYHLYFNFSINSRNLHLEPNLPALEDRLGQLEWLCSRFGPDKITWRFDPICFYRIDDSPVENNLDDFASIAECAGQLGIRKCVTSFADHYAKIKKRASFLAQKGKPVPVLVDPDIAEKIDIITRMQRLLDSKGIALNLCCEHSVFSHLPIGLTVDENACIDGRQLKKIYAGNPVVRRDYGQRASGGCKCTQSIDIGSYKNHPCFHNCFFCYANPAMDREIRSVS